MVSINSLSELTSYFSAKIGELTLVNTFLFGGLRQVIERQHEPNSYPMAVFSPPDVNFKGDRDNVQQTYEVRLMVIQDANLLEGNEWKTSLEAMETAAKQLIIRFVLDFNLKPELFSLEPVEGLSHDNLYGWQIVFEMQIWTPLCIDSEVWQ